MQEISFGIVTYNEDTSTTNVEVWPEVPKILATLTKLASKSSNVEEVRVMITYLNKLASHAGDKNSLNMMYGSLVNNANNNLTFADCNYDKDWQSGTRGQMVLNAYTIDNVSHTDVGAKFIEFYNAVTKNLTYFFDGDGKQQNTYVAGKTCFAYISYTPVLSIGSGSVSNRIRPGYHVALSHIMVKRVETTLTNISVSAIDLSTGNGPSCQYSMAEYSFTLSPLYQRYNDFLIETSASRIVGQVSTQFVQR